MDNANIRMQIDAAGASRLILCVSHAEAMTTLMPKDEELYQRLDEVIHYIWDPIGISQHPEARDEYHTYLPEIYARVKVGKKDHVLEYMEWIVTNQMGMVFGREKAEQVAELMLNWKEVILKEG